MFLLNLDSLSHFLLPLGLRLHHHTTYEYQSSMLLEPLNDGVKFLAVEKGRNDRLGE